MAMMRKLKVETNAFDSRKLAAPRGMKGLTAEAQRRKGYAENQKNNSQFIFKAANQIEFSSAPSLRLPASAVKTLNRGDAETCLRQGFGRQAQRVRRESKE
jgi:hypothetical protein